MTTFRTQIIEAAATIAAACVKTCVITIEDARDGVTGQTIKSKSGEQVYALTLAGVEVPEMVDRYQCKPGAEKFPAPSIAVYTAIFTEIHRRVSKLHAGEFCGRIINCAEVK